MSVLNELRHAAAARRTARERVAAARWGGHDRSPGFDVLRQELASDTARWAALLPQAVREGHTMADVARAAGIAAPSLYYRLRSSASSSVTEVGASTDDTVADQQNQARPSSS